MILLFSALILYFVDQEYDIGNTVVKNYHFKHHIQDHQKMHSMVIDSGEFFNPSILPLGTGNTEFIIFAFKNGKIREQNDIFEYNVPNYCITDNRKCEPKKLKLNLDLKKYRDADIADRYHDFEDVRVMYSPTGDIILVISCPSILKYQERTSCIISAQQLIPELKAYVSAKPLYPLMVAVGKVKEISNWPKNQIPILFESEIYMYSINPDIFYKLDGSGNTEIISDIFNSCTTKMINEYPDSNSAHLGSNFLRLILCKTGKCESSIHNTVIIQVIHVVYITKLTARNRHPYYYRIFQARNTTFPYKPVFYTDPFFLDEYDPNILIYSESINFKYNNNNLEKERDVGYLDTQVVLGSGIDMWERTGSLAADFTFENITKHRRECK